MTEGEALAWLEGRGWMQGEAGTRLRKLVDLVLDESQRQNLVSARSRDEMWARHVVDSAQLLAIAPVDVADTGLWVDLGTGAGFPGLVVACLRAGPTWLVEARPLRTGFLSLCARELGLVNVTVHQGKVEQTSLPVPAAIISARAYAPLDRLLPSAHHLSDENTVWLLPKGRQGEKELALARQDWQAVFHVEQSLTDPESQIVTIKQLMRRPVATRQISGVRKPPFRRR